MNTDVLNCPSNADERGGAVEHVQVRRECAHRRSTGAAKREKRAEAENVESDAGRAPDSIRPGHFFSVAAMADGRIVDFAARLSP